MLNHNGIKILTTARLTLRPFRIEDAEDMYNNWAHDPEVTRYVTWEPHESVNLTRELLKNWTAGYDRPNYYNWAMEHDGEVIGNVEVMPTDKWEAAELGYCMSRRFWNQGYMSEAVGAITDFLFGEVGYHRLRIRHIRDNPASGRVAEKNGYTFEGIERELHMSHEGLFRDILGWSLLREEWARRKEGAGDRIRTERMILRPPTMDDFDAIHGWAGNRDSVKYMFWGPNTPADTVSYIQGCMTDWAMAEPKRHEFVLTRNEDGAVIGACNIFVTGELGEAGWILHPDYRHQGYALEAGRGLLRYGFRKLELHRIRARCDTRNLPSYRVMERLGMRREAEFKSARFTHGAWHDEYEYAILREEFEC